MSRRSEKVEKCLRLAADPAASPGEKQAAINAANRLIEADEVPYSASNSQPYPWQWSAQCSGKRKK